MANDNFFSFDEALDELRLQEEELKRLVSEGEIRAFREGETMKLRRADVEALRSELSGGEVVDLGDVSDDLVFEDDPGMITEDLSDPSADTLLDDEEDDDDVEDVGEIDLDTEDFDDDELEEELVERTTITRSATPAVEEDAEEVWVRGLMIATTVVLILVMPVCIAVSTGEFSDIAKSVAGILAEVPK
ncbi:MAG: excisionase family DNA binding protein [Planctomycetota bacterium]